MFAGIPLGVRITSGALGLPLSETAAVSDQLDDTRAQRPPVRTGVKHSDLPAFKHALDDERPAQGETVAEFGEERRIRKVVVKINQS